jgi:hypothetical protein
MRLYINRTFFSSYRLWKVHDPGALQRILVFLYQMLLTTKLYFIAWKHKKGEIFVDSFLMCQFLLIIWLSEAFDKGTLIYAVEHQGREPFITYMKKKMFDCFIIIKQFKTHANIVSLGSLLISDIYICIMLLFFLQILVPKHIQAH